jgi:hypothetical protein
MLHVTIGATVVSNDAGVFIIRKIAVWNVGLQNLTGNLNKFLMKFCQRKYSRLKGAC